MVEVVNMRTCSPPWGQPGDVRIDRGTKWGNPYRMVNPEDRDWIINQYENARRDVDVTELLTAKRLGCWCKPKRCHGDFLKKRIEDALKKQQKTLEV